MYDRISKLGSIGVWECDLATEALSWTSAVYDMFDLPHDYPVNRVETLAWYESNSRRELEALRFNAIATCSSFTIDAAIRTKANNSRWIRITGDVEQQDGKAARIFGTKQDITLEKEAQLQLQALQTEQIHFSRLSAINTMGSTLAHELNQPLAAIAMYVTALRNKEREQSDVEMLDILDGIERCALKSGEILKAVRRMSARGKRSPTLFHLSKEIVEACSVALAGISEGLTVRYEMLDGLKALGDPVQIQQVVINLIRNACDAMANSAVRELTIRTAERDGQAEVSICDTGTGILAEVTHTLFDPFISSKPDGTGVGLAISRTIVEAHSGTLIAENNVGGGATFRFNISSGPCQSICTAGVLGSET